MNKNYQPGITSLLTHQSLSFLGTPTRCIYQMWIYLKKFDMFVQKCVFRKGVMSKVWVRSRNPNINVWKILLIYNLNTSFYI